MGRAKGYKPTEEQKRKNREAHKGENNHHWRGGTFKDYGYILVLNIGHPFANSRGYIRVQRLVMEKFLGRYLTPDEVVHHVDGNKENNVIENLMLFGSVGEHTKYHRLLRRTANK